MLRKTIAIGVLIGLGIGGRLVPHLPNATPITSVALAAGRSLGRTWAVVVPLAALLASDLVIGLYDWRAMASVYVSFALIALMGRRARGFSGVTLTLVGSSLLFFIVTNFAVWAFSPWYAKTLDGLWYCYAMGLPFMRNMLLGDLAYSGALLGAVASFKNLYRLRAVVDLKLKLLYHHERTGPTI